MDTRPRDADWWKLCEKLCILFSRRGRCPGGIVAFDGENRREITEKSPFSRQICAYLYIDKYYKKWYD